MAVDKVIEGWLRVDSEEVGEEEFDDELFLGQQDG